MQLHDYITALTKIDGYIWEIIGAMKADMLFQQEGEQTEGEDLKRLRYGQGCITQKQRKRPDGSIYKWYEGKVSRNGKVTYVTGRTKQLCYDKLIGLNNDIEALVEQTDFTFGEWVEKWLTVYKTNIRPKTREDYRQTVADFLYMFTEKQLYKLKAVDLQEVINSVAQDRPRRARTVYDVLHGSLTEAWNNDYLPKDLAKALKRPIMPDSKEETPLTEEQQQALMNLADKQLAQIFTAYLWSGCRLNELLTLRPEFWDRKNKTLFIDGTKTKASKRTIPVFPPLQQVFEELPMDGEFIFQISEKTLKRRKEEIQKQVGFHFTYKALRHTFNQNLTELGIEDIVRASWMGHSKPSTTKKTYTHVTQKLQNEAIKTVLESLAKNDD